MVRRRGSVDVEFLSARGREPRHPGRKDFHCPLPEMHHTWVYDTRNMYDPRLPVAATRRRAMNKNISRPTKQSPHRHVQPSISLLVSIRWRNDNVPRNESTSRTPACTPAAALLRFHLSIGSRSRHLHAPGWPGGTAVFLRARLIIYSQRVSSHISCICTLVSFFLLPCFTRSRLTIPRNRDLTETRYTWKMSFQVWGG